VICKIKLLQATHCEANAIKTREHRWRNRGANRINFSKMTGIKRVTQNNVLNATNRKVIAPRSGGGKNFSMHKHHYGNSLSAKVIGKKTSWVPPVGPRIFEITAAPISPRRCTVKVSEEFSAWVLRCLAGLEVPVQLGPSLSGFASAGAGQHWSFPG
jgi:hypothetical protein